MKARSKERERKPRGRGNLQDALGSGESENDILKISERMEGRVVGNVAVVYKLNSFIF